MLRVVLQVGALYRNTGLSSILTQYMLKRGRWWQTSLSRSWPPVDGIIELLAVYLPARYPFIGSLGDVGDLLWHPVSSVWNLWNRVCLFTLSNTFTCPSVPRHICLLHQQGFLLQGRVSICSTVTLEWWLGRTMLFSVFIHIHKTSQSFLHLVVVLLLTEGLFVYLPDW